MQSKYFFRFFCFFSISLLGLLPVSTTAFTSFDFLKTDGRFIRNNSGTGDTVYLRGVNFGGWLIHEKWMTPFDSATDDWGIREVLTKRFGDSGMVKLLNIYQDAWAKEKDLANIADEKMSVIRLPIHYLNLMDKNGNWRRNSQGEIDFSRIDWFVSTAEKYGLYTILDFHGAPGSQNGWDHSGKVGAAELFTSESNMALSVTFWQEMARHYEGNPAVAGYDLLNEPAAATDKTQWDFYDRLYKAIRAIDPDHIIIMEEIWNWWDLPNPSDYGWRNVMYEFHYYDWNHTNDFEAYKAAFEAKLNSENGFEAYNIPHFFGEFNFFSLDTTWKYCLDKCNKMIWHWAFWTYKLTQKTSNWGIYNVLNYDARWPALTTDSYNDIALKWSQWDTDTYFERHNDLADIIKTACQADGGTRHRLSVDSVPPVITASPQSQSASEGATATFAVSATGSYLRYQWLQGVWPLPDQIERTLTLSNLSTALDKMTYRVIVSNPWGSDTSNPATLTVSDFTGPLVRKTSNPITIDGASESAWQKADSMTLLNTVAGQTVFGNDIGAVVKTLFDSTYLYLLLNVTDDIRSSNHKDAWNRDGAEIFFDMDNSKSQSYDADDRQYRFLWNNPDFTEEKHQAIAGIQFAQQNTANGYRFEIAFPWSTLGKNCTDAAVIGFDAQVIDNDDTTRESKIAWAATADLSYRIPAAFGMIKREGSAVPILKESPTKGAVTRQPFTIRIAQHQIRIEGPVDAPMMVTVWNLQGRSITQTYSSLHHATLPAARIPRGIYLISIQTNGMRSYYRQLLIP